MAKKLAGAFSRAFKRRSSGRLQTINLREFTGGLNAVDDDELLSPKYQKILRNMYRGTDGSLCLRFGTFLFSNLAGYITGNIIDLTYFKERLICVTDTGQIAAIADDGTVYIIWNTTIAGALPGAPAGWSSGLTQVTFVPFSDSLVIHNGVDKPLSVSTLYAVTYLQDLATGSNVNVPIGKYGCTASTYHCVAGIPGEPTLIILSATKTAGTFPGDPVPNDAIEIEVGSYSPSETTEIQGIIGYRENLIVFFRQDAIILQLGQYVDQIHTPIFADTLPHFGLISQRAIVPIENDVLFADPIGIGSAKRNLLAGLVESEPLSSLIKPLYMRNLRGETVENLQKHSFAVHNEISGSGSGQAFFFTPNHSVFVYTFLPELKIKAWSEYTGWDWVVAACQSAQGRVFLTDGTKIFQHGNNIYENEDVTGDRLYDHNSTWQVAGLYTTGDLVKDFYSGVVYQALIDHQASSSGTFEMERLAYPERWTQYLGEPIDFEVELPWIEARAPMHVKHAKYLRVGSKGTAAFTVEAYADGMYKDIDEAIIYNPGLSIDLVGNQYPGWGEPQEDLEFGGGRKSNYPKLLGFPIKFTRLKLVISGSTQFPFRLLWVALLYKLGSLHR